MRNIFYLFIIALACVSLCSCTYRVRHHSAMNADANSISVSASSAEKVNTAHQQVSVPIEHENGVLMIPVMVNDVPMKFIFDTGASEISISLTEANFLAKQGSLTDDDVVGTSEFTDANGDISEGAVIILRKVQLGNVVLHNVQASVVMNQGAPLLLGQTALSKFGKVEIDYTNNKLIFE